MKIKHLYILQLILVSSLKAQVPNAAAGRIVRHASFTSSFVASRNIDVWLPDGYDTSKKYAVLYMHDGQMLYDKSITWNKQAWDVDDVAHRLGKAGEVLPFIVVGIWNTGAERRSEYFPQQPFESLTAEEKEIIHNATKGIDSTAAKFTVKSDNYLRFLVTELKPFIDATYATLSDRANTFVAGSSMGGLISMYAICEYPQVFGSAACISTHWPGIVNINNNPIPNAFLRYLQKYLPDPTTHRIYFDCGDATLDSLYPPLQKKVDQVMKTKGYTSKNWMTSYLTGGVAHSEQDWNFRLHQPLIFMLGVANKSK